MSYAINFTVSSKAAAKKRVVREMHAISETQPAHKRDMHAAITAAHVFIDMLAEKPDLGVRVDMYGSLGWEHDVMDPYGHDPKVVTSANVNVTAYHVAVTEPLGE